MNAKQRIELMRLIVAELDKDDPNILIALPDGTKLYTANAGRADWIVFALNSIVQDVSERMGAVVTVTLDEGT